MTDKKNPSQVPIVKRKKLLPMEVKGVIDVTQALTISQTFARKKLQLKHNIYIVLFNLFFPILCAVILRLLEVSNEAFLTGMGSLVIGMIVYPYLIDFLFQKLFLNSKDNCESCFRLESDGLTYLRDSYMAKYGWDRIENIAINDLSLTVSFGDNGALFIPVHFFDGAEDINKWVLEFEKRIAANKEEPNS